MMKHRTVGFLFASMALVVLAGCAPEFNPPPGYKGGFLWDSDKSRSITVAPGDTVFSIARRYDTPSRVIIARNGLVPPYTLTAGQTLVLDPVRMHTVISGDTLSQLAVSYNIEMRLLAAANDLGPPYTIRVGQQLWIPDPFSIAAAPTARMAAAEPPPPVAVPRVPRNAISTDSLAPPPGTPQQPSGVVTQSAPMDEPFVPRTPAPLEPAAPAGVSPDVPGPIPVPAPGVTPAEPQVAVATPAPLPEPAARATARFAWPLRGKVIANFGVVGKGLHNDGINIAAPAGTQIRAADNGVVAYAGNELKGFGNLLLIKHADGWTTAYAHSEKLLVSRGDVVQQGQVIATVGRTGNVDTPQLHFEVRKGTQAMNPVAHLAQME